MRRVLFLDVDGVLNCHLFLSSLTELTRRTVPSKHGERNYDPADMIDPMRVEKLNAIIEGLDVEVVLSSSWRHAYDIPTMQDFRYCPKLKTDQTRTVPDFLDRKGFRGTLTDATPNDPGDRADEIRKWLKQNVWREEIRFVVLDDSPDAGVGLEDVFVQTHQGLEDADVAKARLILGDPKKAFPVTDPDLDAPDGAVVDGFERVGDRWEPVKS